MEFTVIRVDNGWIVERSTERLVFVDAIRLQEHIKFLLSTLGVK